MKKLLVILVMICSAVSVQAQTKVGHINSNELIEKLPEADSIKKTIQKEQEMWQRLLTDKRTEMNTKYAAVLELMDDPNVAQAEKEIKTQEIENLQKSYQELEQRANDELTQKQQELLTPLLEKVKNTISEVAKANGYAYVMDTSEGSGIIYSDSSFDLMPLVKAKLGVK